MNPVPNSSNTLVAQPLQGNTASTGTSSPLRASTHFASLPQSSYESHAVDHVVVMPERMPYMSRKRRLFRSLLVPPNISISMGQGMGSQRANLVPIQQQPSGINIISYTDSGIPQTITADGAMNNAMNTSVVTYPFITVCISLRYIH